MFNEKKKRIQELETSITITRTSLKTLQSLLHRVPTLCQDYDVNASVGLALREIEYLDTYLDSVNYKETT